MRPVNDTLLTQLNPAKVQVAVCRVEDAEMDEMWSFVGTKARQRWLWHAIDHASRQVLAYVLAPHEDEAFLRLKALLEPFGIKHFYTDGWGAYQRHLDEDKHIIGKQNTQRIGFVYQSL